MKAYGDSKEIISLVSRYNMMEKDLHSDEEIRSILSLKNVAVVGMSKNEEKAANYVPKYLLENGYNIVPVNPTADSILERKCYPSLQEVPDQIDIVDVFRPSDQVLPVIQEAIKKKPKVIWLQEGIHNEEAENIAKSAGIKVVFNRCMLAEHQRLF
jgi:predicted CoA-binding protein